MLKSRVLVMRRRQVQQQGELWFSAVRSAGKEDSEQTLADGQGGDEAKPPKEADWPSGG